MSETIINGIDASEEIRYCNNCSNLGLDFKARKFYCSLSHRPDELPEVLSCDEFSTNCYIKRLQEENKRLQMLSCANCGEKYLSPDGSELYEKNVQLQKENEELKNRLKTLDDEEFVYEVTEIEYNNFKKMNEYKQALEEIKKWATNHNPCDIEADINCTKEDCFKCLNYDITKITKIINGVFNDN